MRRGEPGHPALQTESYWTASTCSWPLEQEDGLAAQILERVGVDAAAVTRRVEEGASPGRPR